ALVLLAQRREAVRVPHALGRLVLLQPDERREHRLLGLRSAATTAATLTETAAALAAAARAPADERRGCARPVVSDRAHADRRAAGRTAREVRERLGVGVEDAGVLGRVDLVRDLAHASGRGLGDVVLVGIDGTLLLVRQHRHRVAVDDLGRLL